MPGIIAILRRLAALVREEARTQLSPMQTVSGADDSFEVFAADRTLRATRAIIACLIVSQLFFIPSDFITYSDDMPLVRRFILMRLGFALIGVVGYTMLRFARLKTAAWQAIGVATVMNIFFFASMGRLAGLEAPYFYFSFFVPAASMVCLFRLRERIAATAALGSTTLIAFYVTNPHYLSHRYNLVIVSFLFFASIVSVLAGHIRYQLERDGFDQRRQLARYAQEQEELNRVKDAFVATVSHELRTPLNAIIGLTDAALDEPAPPRLKQFLQTMSDSEQVLLRIVNDILDLAKVKSGKLELKPEPVSLHDVTKTIGEFFIVSCRNKGLTLEWRVAEEVPVVLLDLGRVQQIILNLLSNAVKFTDRGGVRLDVTVDGAELLIRVADTGVGVTAAKAEVIFEEFTQVDTSTTRRHGGTGLGLPIVRRLAQLMGGSVELTPNTPTGSVFTVRLPLVPAPVGMEVSAGRLSPGGGVAALPVPRTITSPPPVPSLMRTNGPTILVADDVPENRQLLRVYLESLECNVVFAENGREALEYFRAQRFDLAVLDIEMPELDGYGAVRKMREIEAANGAEPIPIVALTAHGLDEHRERAQQAGFSDHLSKPLRKQQFLAFVESATGAVRRPSSGASA